MNSMENMKGIKPSIVMEQNKHTFTKSETKIYEYIRDHIQQVLYHSLTELSEASGAAEATVLRFFRKLGFKGFQDFKFLLAQEVSLAAQKDDHETIIKKVRNTMIQAINESSEVVKLEELQAGIEMINQSHDVVIFGIGASGIAGLDMQNRLMRIGKHADVVTDSHFQIMRASCVTEKTVVIAISLTGSTKDIVDAVKIAKGNKAKVIALTSYVKSPLTRFADLVLLSSSKESPLDSGALVSKISQLYLIDLLCTGIAMQNFETANEINMKTSKHLSSKLY
ncbi:RpiR family transcriptional regulator [Bacillus sp. FJAT-18017]|nr:MurR/RpiR family transcriptional regulator [Bacillus sp. FJAT-18017]ALC92794.1 RpiR family transcriptional regulator [Bacillus sp. FJAT-18017]